MNVVAFEELVSVIRQRGNVGRRAITAVVGPPASGKSTAAERIAEALDSTDRGCAAVLGMDGFHLDDMVLVPRGLRPRKGAPETFDVAGFAHMLSRLKENSESEIAVPVFDRSIEIARAGARMIPQSVRHLVVEGNYLLLAQGQWAALRTFFDTTVSLQCDETELRARLERRWAFMSPEERTAKIDGNDMPNARLVMDGSVAAEFVLPNG